MTALIESAFKHPDVSCRSKNTPIQVCTVKFCFTFEFILLDLTQALTEN